MLICPASPHLYRTLDSLGMNVPAVSSNVSRITAIAVEGWLELMPMRFVGFEEIGWLENSSDRLVWQFAQSNQMIILVANRSMKGDDSLESKNKLQKPSKFKSILVEDYDPSQ